MTHRERKQKRIIRKQGTEIQELRSKVETLQLLALAEKHRDSLVHRIRQTIKADMMNIPTAVFLFDVMEHQISSHRKFNEFKKRREDGIRLNRKEKWYMDNLFYKPDKDGPTYFLCVTKFLEDSMGVLKRTQSRFFKELKDKGLMKTCTKPNNQSRYVYVDVRKWDRMIAMYSEQDRDTYRSRGDEDW